MSRHAWIDITSIIFPTVTSYHNLTLAPRPPCRPPYQSTQKTGKSVTSPYPSSSPWAYYTPSLLAIMGYFIYLKTLKRHKYKKQLAKQDEEAASGIVKEVEVTREVKKQVRAFIEVGLN